jgi:hypothetical protein
VHELAIFTSLSRAETIRNYFVWLFLSAGSIRSHYVGFEEAAEAERYGQTAIGCFARNVGAALTNSPEYQEKIDV